MWYATTLSAFGVAVIAVLLLALARRRRAHAAPVRLVGAVALGAALGALAFSVLTRIPAELDWLYAYNYPRLSDDPAAEYDAALAAHKGAIVDELWARELIPPAQRRPCYTADATVCALADAVAARAIEEYHLNRGAGFYGLRLWLGFSLGVIGGALAWVLARPRPAPGDAPPTVE